MKTYYNDKSYVSIWNKHEFLINDEKQILAEYVRSVNSLGTISPVQKFEYEYSEHNLIKESTFNRGYDGDEFSNVARSVSEYFYSENVLEKKVTTEGSFVYENTYQYSEYSSGNEILNT